MTQQRRADGCQHWGDPGQNRESNGDPGGSILLALLTLIILFGTAGAAFCWALYAATVAVLR